MARARTRLSPSRRVPWRWRQPFAFAPRACFSLLSFYAAVREILAEGTGECPNDGDEVSAHYTGTLLDGSKFDSSVDRGTPFKFQLGQGRVIKGWDQGFATMKKGEKAILTCAPEYAYGANGSPPKIPPNSTLKFEVELLGFGPKKKEKWEMSPAEKMCKTSRNV